MAFLNPTLIDRLQAVQNCAARFVTPSRKHDHITPIFKQLHWLPMYSRIKYKILMLTFKALHTWVSTFLYNRNVATLQTTKKLKIFF